MRGGEFLTPNKKGAFLSISELKDACVLLKKKHPPLLMMNAFVISYTSMCI
jgi:hypothetical protein